MTTPAFRRARSREQQQQRRAQILGVARELLAVTEPAAVSLRELAREVGLAKSNVVRYFPTREAVFLAVLAEDFDAFLDDVGARLPRLDRRRSVASQRRLIASALAEALADHPRLCDLLAACQTVLEHNVPAETAREFKAIARQWLTGLADCVQAAEPRLDPTAAAEFAGHVWVLVAGVWPMANPNPVVAAVLAEPEFEDMSVDFVPALTRALTVLLAGLSAESAADPA